VSSSHCQIDEQNLDFKYQPLSISEPSTDGTLLRVRMALTPSLTIWLWSLFGVTVNFIPYIDTVLYKDELALPPPATAGIKLNLNSSAGPAAPAAPVPYGFDNSAIFVLLPPSAANDTSITNYEVGECADGNLRVLERAVCTCCARSAPGLITCAGANSNTARV
jgi:hypothetical protein